MADIFFELSHEGAIAHLRLNRPERLNTMTPAFFPALRDAVRGLDAEGGTRVLVVSSTGRHFLTPAGKFDTLRLVGKGFVNNETTGATAGAPRAHRLAGARRQARGQARDPHVSSQRHIFRVEGRELMAFKAGGS